MKTFGYFLLFIFLLPANSESSEWLYYKHLPWVYDDKTQTWLYLWGGQDGKIYAYNYNDQEWSEFYQNGKEESVLSTPGGQSVVVQSGNEYSWSSNLDGVVLWGIEQDGNEVSIATVKFSNGYVLYGFDAFTDDVADLGNNVVSYAIDQNGYIKSLEHDGDYQYYNVVSVENGIIGTIQNDQGVDSVANDGTNEVDQWFFTTKAAAQDYYDDLTAPSVVVTDANGLSVVVKSGNKFSWNSSLDGITLWSVEWQSGQTADQYTYKFENGRNTGNLGFHDQLFGQQPYDKPYVIDENGYLKVTESSYQYYNVVSVENGVIGTIQNDQGVDSVADNGVNQVDQWFFTTKSAAEAFYNSL